MHHHHHRGPGGPPNNPPPPPILSSRSARGPPPGTRSGVRSRSRSRSPSGLPRGSSNTNRYGRSGERGRDLRDRPERERDRDRDRRRSPSPYGSGSRSDRDRDLKHVPSTSSASKGSLQQTSATSGLDPLPSISLIQADPSPSIIRRILNPEEVKIPRRVNEGSRQIFDREELREAMLRRMRSNDNEENPPQSNAYIQEPTVTQQRVVAIIREPVGGADAYLASKDPAFHSIKLSSSGLTGSGSVQPRSPDILRSSSSYHRRPGSTSPSRNTRGGRHSPPPPPTQLSSSARGRTPDRERERLIIEREREQIQRVMERDPRPSGRDRELRERMPERGDRVGDHHRPDRVEHPREREREKPGYGRIELDHRPRSRSPVSRVARVDMRVRRRSRSHSVTPPPMPEEIRRQLIERQRSIDLRNSLSRQPGKYVSPHDDRLKGRMGGPPIRGGGRGRGGFVPRGRVREDGRVWVHDMYDGDDEPKKGD